MKKCLAMLLAMLMLISACAMAEGSFGGKLVVKDVIVDLGGGQELDLSGVDLTLAIANNGAQSGLRLAVDGGAASVLNAILAFDSDKITLRADGISDVYSLSYADLVTLIEEQSGDLELSAAFQQGFETGFSAGSGIAGDEVPAEVTALAEHAAEIFPGALVPAGSETIDGVEHDSHDIVITEDQMAVLLNDFAAIMDLYAADSLAGTGYHSYSAMFADMELKMDVGGKLSFSESHINASIDLNVMEKDMTEPGTLNLSLEMTEVAENNASFSLLLSVIDGEDSMEVCAATGSAVSAEDGEFASFEMTITTPQSAGNEIQLAVYAPSVQENGLWQVSLGVMEYGNLNTINVIVGNANGQDQFSMNVVNGDQIVYIDYAGTDGVGTLSLGMTDDGVSMGGISATVEVAEDDGAWLPGATDSTVNMLNIDETQMNKLSMEGMSLMMNAMASLAQANETLGALLSGMMG